MFKNQPTRSGKWLELSSVPMPGAAMEPSSKIGGCQLLQKPTSQKLSSSVLEGQDKAAPAPSCSGKHRVYSCAGLCIS